MKFLNKKGFTLIELMIVVAIIGILAAIIVPKFSYGMGSPRPSSSDAVQASQQEQLATEAAAQTGMPSIKNFFERKTMKMIMEMRDQSGLITYTYMWNEMQGKRVFLCNSIGYGLPYSTQYTNPEKIVASGDVNGNGYASLPQADPNGLFMPSSAQATWVLCKDPKGDDVKPVYVEPNIIVSPFPLD